MAQKRMIDKKISLSEKLSELPIGAQLLYTWMIPHADDFGLFQGSPRTIKAQVMPMADVTVKDATEWIDGMLKRGLLKQFEYKGKDFYYVVGFEENQTLRKDMQPYTVLPVELSGRKYSENWNSISEIVAKQLGRKFVRTTSDEIEPVRKEHKEAQEGSKEVVPSSAPKNDVKEEEKTTQKYSDDPLVEYCRSQQGIGVRFVNYGKQLQALKRIRDAGYSDDEDIKFVIEEMAEDPYWKTSPFDMNQVADNMHKYLNREVRFDQPQKYERR